MSLMASLQNLSPLDKVHEPTCINFSKKIKGILLHRHVNVHIL